MTADEDILGLVDLFLSAGNIRKTALSMKTFLRWNRLYGTFSNLNNCLVLGWAYSDTSETVLNSRL